MSYQHCISFLKLLIVFGSVLFLDKDSGSWNLLSFFSVFAFNFWIVRKWSKEGCCRFWERKKFGGKNQIKFLPDRLMPLPAKGPMRKNEKKFHTFLLDIMCSNLLLFIQLLFFCILLVYLEFFFYKKAFYLTFFGVVNVLMCIGIHF